MRMPRTPQVRADLSSLTCRARAIRITAGAFSTSNSEGELKGHLNAPRVVRLCRGIDCPEGCVCHPRNRSGEEYVIERIQQLSPELDVLVFKDFGLLNHREIKVVDLIGAEKT